MKKRSIDLNIKNPITPPSDRMFCRAALFFTQQTFEFLRDFK